MSDLQDALKVARGHVRTNRGRALMEQLESELQAGGTNGRTKTSPHSSFKDAKNKGAELFGINSDARGEAQPE